jgi:hypothetical protein
MPEIALGRVSSENKKIKNDVIQRFPALISFFVIFKYIIINSKSIRYFHFHKAIDFSNPIISLSDTVLKLSGINEVLQSLLTINILSMIESSPVKILA